MKVFVLGVFLVVFLASSFVRCDEDDDNELERRFFFRQSCQSHQQCPEHQYCCSGWFKYCRNLPRCYRHFGCPRGTVCKTRVYSNNNVYHSYGQCVRVSRCSADTDCDQSTECCKRSGYFRYCAKRPQEGQRCCPRNPCFKCAEGLVCERKQHHFYGKCSIPTTIRPTTEEGSGDYDRGLLE